MGSAWRTRTSTAATTTTLPPTTLSISSNAGEQSHRSLYVNRQAPQALPHRARETVPSQGSRSHGHVRSEVGTEAAGEGTAAGRRPKIEPPAGCSRSAGLLGPAADFSGHGRGWEGRNNQTRHVGSESAGRGRVVLQSAVGGRIGP